MEAVQLGPFFVNWRVLSFIVGLIAGYVFIRLRIRVRPAPGASESAELLFNGAIIGLLGWKLAPLLEQPSLLLSPVKLLMLQGGGRQAAIGTAIAFVYVVVTVYRRRLSLGLTFDLLAAGAAALLTVWASIGGWRYGAPTSLPWGIAYGDAAVAYHPLNVYAALLGVALLVVLLWRYPPGDGKGAVFVCIVAGPALLVISLLGLKPTVQPVFGLTAAQWSCVALLVFGIFLPRLHTLSAVRQERGLVHMNNNDSGAQREHERENRESAVEHESISERGLSRKNRAAANPDKKLDGPNRPAE